MNINNSSIKRILEEKELDYILKNNKNILKYEAILNKVLKHRLSSVSLTTEQDLKEPNWPFLRAYRDGRYNELEWIRNLINGSEE